MYRKQIEQISQDLEKKMVFIVGPRQVGKTWLAKEIGKKFTNTVYLNYDRAEDRQIMKKEQWPSHTELLVFDELHKMKGWKNYLKGVFDTKESGLRILVTGSARMDTFRKSGDSLAGRFFVHHLFPISLAEIKDLEHSYGINHFIRRGGFPEPFLADSDDEAERWRAQYADGLVRTDILNFETLHNMKAVQMIFDLLRERVGSPISYSAIASDVELSPLTVKKYIEIFEALYIVFRVTPHSRNIARSILKEPKIYFYDTGLVHAEEGVKFENLIAVSLLKHLAALTDATGKNHRLHYLRTKQGHEVDFALVKENIPMEMIEVKLSDGELSKNLQYFSDKYKIHGRQVVKNLKRERTVGINDIVLAEKFLKNLYL